MRIKYKVYNINKYYKLMPLFKICFTMRPIDTSFGGGNQFLNNLIQYLSSKYINIVYDLTDNDIDMIFMMDPRKLTLNKITLDMVIQYKITHPNVIVIQRVNDSDKPRDAINVLDPITLKSLNTVVTTPIFVSEFTKEYYESKGYAGNSYVIMNGCNINHFAPKQNYVYDPKIIRIVTHHWSDNWNKGFEFYNALDEYINLHPEIEFTFIGRKYNAKYTPKNVKIIGPFSGKELGDKLKEFDLYITGAKWENCPMHVVEALASGLPILYYDNLGGGVPLCQKYGESYHTVDEMIEKLNMMIPNLLEYRTKINYNELSSEICNDRYYDAIISTLLVNKYKVPNIVGTTPLWLKRLLLWLIKIEQHDYKWSLQGFNEHKLGSIGLFAKLATIFSNYYNFNKQKMYDEMHNFFIDGVFKDIEKEIISETRQAISGIINMGFTVNVNNIKIDEYFKELYFMTDQSWKNPWGAGAHLSHYLFFMKLLDRQDKIEHVLLDLKQYEHPNGWYFGTPNKHYIVNGIMKVFTGFDIINLNISSQMATNIIEYILPIDDSFGGCGIYDYVYVMTKCMDCIDNDHLIDLCKERLRKIYNIILRHQQNDGGFKYDISNDKAHKYYNTNIIPDGMIGNIHSTTLFCMALSRLDKYLKLNFDLNLAIS